jgi:hypothetical protein
LLEAPVSDPRLRVTQRGPAGEDAIIAALDDTTVALIIEEDVERRDVQLMLLAMVDLLGRVFPRIAVTGADTAAHPELPPGPTKLTERITEARANGIEPLEPEHPTITVAIGRAAAPADLHIDAAGWQSYLGTEPSQLDVPGGVVPVGALAAACRGAAHTFAAATRSLFSGFAPPIAVYSSALTWRHASSPLDEPAAPDLGVLEAVLVGAGSVGGAAVYTLARTPDLTGALDIVDPQTLEPENFDRALLAGRRVAAGRPEKTAVAAAALAHLAPGLDARAHHMTVGEFVASRSRETPLPLVLCAVDSARARRSLQDCLPLEVINAACWPEEIAVSGHVTDRGPCVCCLHMRELLNAETIQAKLIAGATGMNFLDVVVMLAQRVPLPLHALRFIEMRTSRPEGSLTGYAGRLLIELWREQFLYGAATLRTPDGTVAAVAAPWVTALAGTLLAGEALKSTSQPAACWRLGPDPDSPAIKYSENPYNSPGDALLTRPERWEGAECLCRSPRRLELLRQRYGLQ